MRDGQYLSSLATSAAVAAVVLLALFGFVAWAGWRGAAAVLVAPGLFLAWFYRGRRTDLVPAGGGETEGDGKR